MSDSLKEALRNASAFRGVTEQDLQELANGCTEMEVVAGQAIITQGEPGNELYIVVAGAFEVLFRDEDAGVEKSVKQLKEGDLVGEIALLIDVRRTATVRAKTSGRIGKISRGNFDTVLDRSPTLARSMLRTLALSAAASYESISVIPFVTTDEFPNAADFQDVIPALVVTACEALAVNRSDDRVTVAMVDPYNRDTRDFLTQVLAPLKVEFVAISQNHFESLHRRISTGTGSPNALLGLRNIASNSKVRIVSSGTSETEFQEDSRTDQFLKRIFMRAIATGATDIHFEPRRNSLKTRIRIDGKLIDISEPVATEDRPKLIQRLKVLANLVIIDHRHPQDGSFAVEVDEKLWIDIRVGVLSIHDGEKAALRLIPTQNEILPTISDLIHEPRTAVMATRLFNQPSGIVLVTGPTGGGKTTTIYTALQDIWNTRSNINLVSVENPVERVLDFVNQTQIDEAIGRTFPIVLRALLRQDPDVILIGEIRDEESAEIAFEAANTGHLVLASLHGHFVHQAIARIRSLEVEPYLIASSLNGIISQRLVPLVCENCSRPMEDSANNSDVRALQNFGLLTNDLSGLRVGAGCDQCSGQGERHRAGLFELLSVNDDVRAHIYKGDPISEAVLKQSGGSGYFPMKKYAQQLLESGKISPASALRSFPTT
ncbi:MAG: type II secretory ATPase GspE/PulE/Tfp pilus assembly ATPase PilB-like protein [Verrucomicrobiales bacterium]|jgi:type II secretory ATPase GspE/PulE/Tfp pilus assembly ATPase PilB-like protein